MNHLIYLRTFLDAYRAGSLTRAAQRLGITQPAASAHIASLETMLGKPLFVRKARGVAPTPAADDLARAIAANLDGIEATMVAAQARSARLTGTVHLVGPAEYLSLRVVPALAPLIAEGLRLRIQTGNRERIYSALDEGHVDLAVTASRPGQGIRLCRAWSGAAVAPSGPRHRGAHQGPSRDRPSLARSALPRL